MNQNPAPTPHATIEQVLETFATCLSMQRDALVRGDLDHLREAQTRLQEAVSGADLRRHLDRVGGQERDALRQSLRNMLSLCAVNASLAARAESGIRRAREALGQQDGGLYGAAGQALGATRPGRRIDA